MSNALKKITTRAKQIRKLHPGMAWKSAIKKAGVEYRAGTIGKVKTKYRQTGRSNKAADKKRTARRPGKRRSASGKTYYERRKNRSDVPFAMTGKKVNAIGNVLPKLTNKTVEWTLVKKFNTIFFDAGSYYITHRGELIFWSQNERNQARAWLSKNKTIYKK